MQDVIENSAEETLLNSTTNRETLNSSFQKEDLSKLIQFFSILIEIDKKIRKEAKK